MPYFLTKVLQLFVVIDIGRHGISGIIQYCSDSFFPSLFLLLLICLARWMYESSLVWTLTLSSCIYGEGIVMEEVSLVMIGSEFVLSISGATSVCTSCSVDCGLTIDCLLLFCGNKSTNTDWNMTYNSHNSRLHRINAVHLARQSCWKSAPTFRETSREFGFSIILCSL